MRFNETWSAKVCQWDHIRLRLPLMTYITFFGFGSIGIQVLNSSQGNFVENWVQSVWIASQTLHSIDNPLQEHHSRRSVWCQARRKLSTSGEAIVPRSLIYSHPYLIRFNWIETDQNNTGDRNHSVYLVDVTWHGTCTSTLSQFNLIQMILVLTIEICTKIWQSKGLHFSVIPWSINGMRS